MLGKQRATRVVEVSGGLPPPPEFEMLRSLVAVPFCLMVGSVTGFCLGLYFCAL